MTNSFSPDFCCISILCSGAACPNKPAFTRQTAVFFCCHDSSYLSQRREVAWFMKWIYHDKNCLQEASSRCVYTDGMDVWVCFCLFLFGAHCGLSCLCLLCICACLFVPLKGLAQSRPFVVGRSGHPAQLVWLMDVSHNCISLRPEIDCPSSWCESLTNLPTLTALNRNWYKHQICLTRISRCQSINSYIDAAQKRSRSANEIPAWENKPSEADFTLQQQVTCPSSESLIVKCSKVYVVKVQLRVTNTFQTKTSPHPPISVWVRDD